MCNPCAAIGVMEHSQAEFDENYPSAIDQKGCQGPKYQGFIFIFGRKNLPRNEIEWNPRIQTPFIQRLNLLM